MGRPRNPNKRLKRFVAPANDDEIEEYENACRIAEVQPAETIRKLARALVAQVAEYGYVTSPIRLAAPEKRPTKHGQKTS